MLTRYHLYFSKGHNSGKGIILMEKIRVSYVFMKNPYMKFQNPSMHGSEFMHRKHAMLKCPKLQRAITHEVLYRII